MKGKNKRSGISLIVLVITIIVIIILAVAVILTLSNNNPIENAKKAVSANDEATLKEEATLLYADWYLKENSTNPTGIPAQKYVIDNLKGNYGELKYRLQVSASGEIKILKQLPPEVVEGVTIPRGFEHVLGTTVDTGLVIKNSSDGNEFVWVPVDVEDGKTFEEIFEREAGYMGLEIQDWNKTDYEEPFTNSGAIEESEEIIEYNAMVASVKKYGGFYIARYEASQGTDAQGNTIAQSISKVFPWVSIAWGDSMDKAGNSGAVGKARAVYPVKNANEGDPVSTLIYGVQWDATINWLEETYNNISKDSSGKGNSWDGSGSLMDCSVIYTGVGISLNNIYDMAGNVFDMTMETFSNNERVARGSIYNQTADSFPISYRERIGINGNEMTGFRLALYIK